MQYTITETQVGLLVIVQAIFVSVLDQEETKIGTSIPDQLGNCTLCRLQKAFYFQRGYFS
jgi:hypothetical protein